EFVYSGCGIECACRNGELDVGASGPVRDRHGKQAKAGWVHVWAQRLGYYDLLCWGSGLRLVAEKYSVGQDLSSSDPLLPADSRRADYIVRVACFITGNKL